MVEPTEYQVNLPRKGRLLDVTFLDPVSSPRLVPDEDEGWAFTGGGPETQVRSGLLTRAGL